MKERGADDLDVLEIVMRLELATGNKLPYEDEDWKTPAEIENYIIKMFGET